MDDDPTIESIADRDQPMARVTNPLAPSAANSPLSGVPIADDHSTASTIRDALSGKQVCPFCGSQNPASGNSSGASAGSSSGSSASSGPCPRCTMEDSAATRQATKARIGPWHVLQTRNPAAPGMRYATLLALVGKGQVTARSVVRGPTTHQLWRYAAYVRGLSREFGICYSCGEPLDKTAANCPHCDRAQEPMGNPDLLLESREPASTMTSPPSTSVSSISGSGVVSAAPLLTSDDVASSDPYSIVTRHPAQPMILSHAERLRTGVDPRNDPRRRPDGRALSAMELAAALQVAPPPPPPKTHPVRTVMITLVIVAIIACGIIGVFRPDLRQQAVDWTQARLAQVEQALANFHLQQEPPSGTSGGVTQTVPAPIDVAPPADSPSAPSPSIKIGPGADAGAAANDQPTPSPIAVPAPTVAPADAVPPAPGIADHSAATAQPPAISAQPSILQDRPMLVGSVPSASEIWQLHSKGLEAEGRQDWAEAVRCYQQIEMAPKDQWPSDVKIRLENASRQLGN